MSLLVDVDLEKLRQTYLNKQTKMTALDGPIWAGDRRLSSSPPRLRLKALEFLSISKYSMLLYYEHSLLAFFCCCCCCIKISVYTLSRAPESGGAGLQGVSFLDSRHHSGHNLKVGQRELAISVWIPETSVVRQDWALIYI